MERLEFIKKMEEKGFVFTDEKYLSKDLVGYLINDDGTINSSSPAGRLKYNSFEDVFNGKFSVIERYRLD